MADFNALQAIINAYIKRNGVQAITGQILNGVLTGMVNALGKGYTVAGAASPTTDPGTMTGPLAYIAYTAGTYTHFDNIVVEQGEVSMLIYNEAEWHNEVLFSLAAQATVDDNIGVPSVGVSFVDGILTFNFRNMKGEPGENGQDGDPAGFGTISASISGGVGTPGVSVQSSGPDTAKNIAFQFTNLKGETGVTSCVVTVDNTTGNPSCAVSLVGQELHLDFSGLKGAQGNTGSSVDYPFTIVNNLTTDDATQALSAAMGVQLESEVSQLEAKVGVKSGLPKYALQPGDFVDGWYWYNNSTILGKLTSSSTYCACKTGIPVIEGDVLFFNLTTAGTGVTLLFTDSNNSVLSAISYNTLAGAKKYIVPSGASFLYINTYKSNKDDSYLIVKGIFLGGILDGISLLEENTEEKSFTPATGSSVSLDYLFKAGKTYFVTNDGPDGVTVWARKDGTNTEQIFNNAPSGTSVEFTPTTDANYIRIILASGKNATIRVNTGLGERVKVLEEEISSIEGEDGYIKTIVDSSMLKNASIPVKYNLLVGRILLDGTYDSNTGFRHLSVDLTDKIIKTFTFAKTYVNNSTCCCYGFIVNGIWIGYEGNASGGNPVTQITANVPDDATEFRVCWNLNQVTEQEIKLSFYGYVSGITDKPKNDIVFQFEPDYVLSRVPAMDCPTEQQASDLTLVQLYAKYDGLMAMYPDYITKIDCDSEVQTALSISAPPYMEGLPIYMYKLCPKIGGNSSGTDLTSRVKVLITSMHPQERLGLYTMFETIKMICDNWKNDVNAEQMRSLVDIYVLPCPWPWNFENHNRVNYNGVNGNRQFPTEHWTETGQGTPDWSGTEPLSEYEAKVVNYFLLKIKPNVSVDVHTSGNDSMGHMGIFSLNRDDQQLIDLCGIIARTTSNRAIQDNPNFPTSPDTCLYGVYPEDGSVKGEFYQYAYEKGCRFSVLSEESPDSKWSNGVFGGTSGPIIEQYTDGILREQVQYLFNTLLRLTRQASVMFYN